MQKALNGMGLGGPTQTMPNPMMQNGQQGQGQGQGQPMMQMSPQQQMEFMSMMEQQARMMAQIMQPGMNPGFMPQQQNSPSRSLLDRVENGRGRGGGRGRGRGGVFQNGTMRNAANRDGGDATMEGDGQNGGAPTSTEGEQGGQQQPPSSVMCHFNKRCKNKDCTYVHSSPAAPDGILVDMNDTCSFGAACKNPHCVGKHPSPANIFAHKQQEMCKFWPNCANPVCPFKHPESPPCKFGAACKNANCPFTHLEVMCKFNPCKNPRCPYKHEEGQHQDAFAAAQWTAESAKAKEHVSERKFVENEGDEELIKPVAAESGQEVDDTIS